MLTYRSITREDSKALNRLISDVFEKDIAVHFTKEGRRTFLSYIAPDLIESRMNNGHWGLIAENDDDMIGTIFVKGAGHIDLFFIRNGNQRKGIGRSLLEITIKRCLEFYPDTGKITVNASPNAVEGYESLGFSSTGTQRELYGIRFTPMELFIR